MWWFITSHGEDRSRPPKASICFWEIELKLYYFIIHKVTTLQQCGFRCHGDLLTLLYRTSWLDQNLSNLRMSLFQVVTVLECRTAGWYFLIAFWMMTVTELEYRICVCTVAEQRKKLWDMFCCDAVTMMKQERTVMIELLNNILRSSNSKEKITTSLLLAPYSHSNSNSRFTYQRSVVWIYCQCW